MSTGVSVGQPMVGRRRELAQLQQLLTHRSADGQSVPTAVVISGEAGIGKSRLVRELIRTAGPGVVLVGEARPDGAGAAFSVLRDAVTRSVLAWQALPEELERFAHPLGHVLTPLLPIEAHPPDGHEHRTDELVVASLALVRHLVGSGPALLVFEDLHWADEESRALFARLADEPLPLLLVGTVRAEEIHSQSNLARTLAGLRRLRRAVHLDLDPLDVEEVGELVELLVDTDVPSVTVAEIHRRTGGNPYLVEELVGALTLASGAARLDPEGVATVPLHWAATEALLSRLGSIRHEAREALQNAAVLVEPFGFELLRGVTGLEEGHLTGVLRSAVDARILAERAADQFVFSHALMRDALARELLGRERADINRRALAIAADLGVPSAHMARYAAGAGDGAAAARHAGEAAELALRDGSPRHALRMAALALEHDPDCGAMHGVAARAAGQLGDTAATWDHAEAWAAWAHGADDCREEAAAWCIAATARWASGERAGAWDAMARAERAVERRGHADAGARVAAVRAQLHLFAGQTHDALEWSDRALRLADEVDDRSTRAHALVTKGTALADSRADEHPDRDEEALAVLKAGRAEAEAIGDVDTLVRALNNSIMPGQGLTSLDETEALIEQGHRVVERYGVERFAAKLASLEAYVAILRGDADAARSALGRAARGRAFTDEMFWASLVVLLHAEAGELDAARHRLEAERPRVEQVEPGEPHVDFALAEAVLAAHAADVELAEQALRRASTAAPFVPTGAFAAWWDTAICTLDAGADPDWVETMRNDHAPRVVRRSAAAAEHFAGALYASRGDTRRAREALAGVVSEPPGFRPACFVAAGLSQLAQACAADGDLEAARAHAAAAGSLLRAWPGPRRDAVEDLRRRLGEAGTRHSLLTPREVEVCRLLVEGRTNREIAEQLYISPKTASVHVSNILAKTGLRSRAQVAAWAVQSGLTRVSDNL